MGREPTATIGEHAPEGSIDGSGNAPEVGIVMSHPSAATIHGACCLCSCLAEVAYHGEERLGCLAEVAYLCRPVVHLRIDVDGILAVPWGVHLVVPYTLKVGRLSTLL